MRRGDRGVGETRPIRIIRNYLKGVEGSVLAELGDTRVVCSATLQDGVPPFLRGTKRGWLTAEYGMLPRSASQRIPRWRDTGRIHEIQRLIGRSLRAVTDLSQFNEQTMIVDCDVIQADGGTRTTAITGGFVALYDAVQKMSVQGMFKTFPISHFVAAISCGIVDGEVLLDLNYEEDSNASADMNVVMTDEDRIVEIQGTAEGDTFTLEQMNEMVSLARKGIDRLIEAQRGSLTIELV